MSTAATYNAGVIGRGELTFEGIAELVRFWQAGHGLIVDGMAGPATVASIEIAKAAAAGRVAKLFTIAEHWLSGDGVQIIKADASWFGGLLMQGKPVGIVAHYTDTGPGTAVNMARRRVRPYGQPDDPKSRASWHLTIDTDGSVVQMIPFHRVANHAGSDTAQPIPGLGWANGNTIGIELVGFGNMFTPAQVATACSVWRAIVGAYGIDRKHAMVTHQSIDPTRRDDPGPEWMGKHAERVLDFAYAP